MVTDIIMPQLGESIAEGTVVKWLVPAGGVIQKDESLLEIETEKVTLEIPSPTTGRLDEIIVKEGRRFRSEPCWRASTVLHLRK